MSNPNNETDARKIELCMAAMSMAKLYHDRAACFLVRRGEKKKTQRKMELDADRLVFRPRPPQGWVIPEHHVQSQAEVFLEYGKRRRELEQRIAALSSVFLNKGQDAAALRKYLHVSNHLDRDISEDELNAHACLENLYIRTTGKAPCRLMVQSNGDKWTAILDSIVYPITSQQGKILERLLDAAGAYVPGAELKTSNSPEERPDRIIGRLPQQIRSLIHTQTGPGGGARLTL